MSNAECPTPKESCGDGFRSLLPVRHSSFRVRYSTFSCETTLPYRAPSAGAGCLGGSNASSVTCDPGMQPVHGNDPDPLPRRDQFVSGGGPHLPMAADEAVGIQLCEGLASHPQH